MLSFQRRDEWFMAKFFYSLEFQGFQFQFFSILELISLSLLTSYSLRWIVHKKLVRWRSKLCSEHFSIVPWFLLTLTFYASLGRQHTLLAIQSMFTPFRIDTAHAGTLSSNSYDLRKRPFKSVVLNAKKMAVHHKSFEHFLFIVDL